jgi:zinc transport system substrate-binding protein
LIACAAGGLSLAPGGCAQDQADDRLKVVVTVAPIAGLVDRVSGGIADVTVMIPPGASPVTYEPALSRVRAAASADLYVSVGHPAFSWENTWLAGLLEQGDATVISGSEDCDILPDDPHVWLSLECARSVAERVAEAVRRARPAAAESIAASLAELVSEMNDMRVVADSALGSHRGGTFITLHPAWGYLAEEYDLRQLAILEHGSGDAGPAELARVVAEARELGLVDVVVQPQFSTEAALLVAHELGGEPVFLDPLAREWSASFLRTVHVLAAEVRP